MSEPPHSVSRVLMTLDAVGGVWRYGMELAAALSGSGIRFVFVGFGPRPSPRQAREAESLGKLIWLDEPLDWTVEDEAELEPGRARLAALAIGEGADLLHLNLPSQAAGLDVAVPVIVVAHSCVPTWFQAVRRTALPPNWAWQHHRNRAGFDAADSVITPSRSHADLMAACYGPIDNVRVIHNAVASGRPASAKESFVFGAARWWDEGKNGAVLDKAADASRWPIILAGPDVSPRGQRMAYRGPWLLGELSHTAVCGLMSRAGIVVSPSLYEPFGLVALEGARAGAALVLSDIPTYRELWDGAALFAAPDDSGAFADAINRLVEDDAFRDDMSRRAEERAQAFSVERQAQALLEAYRASAMRRDQRRSAA